MIIVCNWPAIRPVPEGSTLPSMKGCAIRRGGENGQIWLAGKEAEPTAWCDCCKIGSFFMWRLLLACYSHHICAPFIRRSQAHMKKEQGGGGNKRKKPSVSCTLDAGSVRTFDKGMQKLYTYTWTCFVAQRKKKSFVLFSRCLSRYAPCTSTSFFFNVNSQMSINA